MRVVSVSESTTCAVYDLTVLGRPEFFAGGVLVSNCYDALRYLLAGLKGRTNTGGDLPAGVPTSAGGGLARAGF